MNVQFGAPPLRPRDRATDPGEMIRSTLSIALAGALLALPAAASADTPTYESCLAEQAENLNVDCVTAAQVGKKPRKKHKPRTVRVTWSLGGCAGEPASGWEWQVRFIRDDRLGTILPAEGADGTRHYLFGGTSQVGSHDVRLKRGAYFVDLGLEHAYSPDGGDCGPVDVRSQRFVVR